jgi:hypothetical protein
MLNAKDSNFFICSVLNISKNDYIFYPQCSAVENTFISRKKIMKRSVITKPHFMNLTKLYCKLFLFRSLNVGQKLCRRF